MARGTDEGLASRVNKNPIIIQNLREDQIHIKDSLKLLSMDGDGDFRIEKDEAVDLESEGSKERRLLIIEWLFSTFNLNPRCQSRSLQKVSFKT